MVLPNTHMITQELMNHTKRNVLRIDVPFGIAYKEVPDEARAALLSLFEGDDRVLTEPAPNVVVTEMADSSVNMALRFYTRNPDQEVPLRWEYTEKVREKLREATSRSPFPTVNSSSTRRRPSRGRTFSPPWTTPQTERGHRQSEGRLNPPAPLPRRSARGA
jgi:Small-conductance mechanosensitive channel